MLLHKILNTEEIGIALDLDGVIINTCSIHEQSWYRVAQYYGLPWKQDLNYKQDVFGTSSLDSLRILFNSHLSSLDSYEIIEYKNKIYKEFLHSINIDSITVHGFIDFFEQIMQMHIPTTIVTSSLFDEAKFILKALKIYSYFIDIIDISKVKNPKPHPEAYIKACACMHLLPSKVIGFEDSLTGILALNNANIKCIVVGTSISLDKLTNSKLDFYYFIQNYTADPFINKKEELCLDNDSKIY